MDTAGVGIVVVFSVSEELGREAPTAEVIGDVLAHEIEILVRVPDEFQSLGVLEADEFNDHMWHERVSSRGIESQGFLPMGVEKPENEMVGRDLTVRGHDD